MHRAYGSAYHPDGAAAGPLLMHLGGLHPTPDPQRLLAFWLHRCLTRCLTLPFLDRLPLISVISPCSPKLLPHSGFTPVYDLVSGGDKIHMDRHLCLSQGRLMYFYYDLRTGMMCLRCLYVQWFLSFADLKSIRDPFTKYKFQEGGEDMLQ